MGSPEVGCNHVLANLWVYIDHEIDTMTCGQLDAHLAGCASCQRLVRFDTHFKEWVRRCADPGPVPPERVQALVLRVRQNLPPSRQQPNLGNQAQPPLGSQAPPLGSQANDRQQPPTA